MRNVTSTGNISDKTCSNTQDMIVPCSEIVEIQKRLGTGAGLLWYAAAQCISRNFSKLEELFCSTLTQLDLRVQSEDDFSLIQKLLLGLCVK